MKARGGVPGASVLLVMWKCVIFFVFLCGVAQAENRNFTFINRCQKTIWVGALNSGPKDPLPHDGGWELAPGETKTVSLPDQWSGRFWGRTQCQFNSVGSCTTGDCGGRKTCSGIGGQTPATLAEFTLSGAGDKDYYDLSLVDGYNLPVKIEPTRPKNSPKNRGVKSSVKAQFQSKFPAKFPGEFREKVQAKLHEKNDGTKPEYECGSPTCHYDLNSTCPPELQVVNEKGSTVGCLSACEKFNTDRYCCRNAHGSPETCPPTEYSKIFKKACPMAYSYAYDDSTSTFTCKDADYALTFCPS